MRTFPVRRLLVTRVIVGATTLALVVSGGAAIAPAVRAAPAAPAVVFGPPAEGAKVTLGETSLDGPAVWTTPSGDLRGVLAWTGTDVAHHLNYLTSSDGLHYTYKHTLDETSLWRPAVTFDSGGRAGFIVLAWIGTDRNHWLNLLYIDAFNGAPLQTVTLRTENSFTAPTVAALGTGEVLLAWAGTDAQHTLNTLTFSVQRQPFNKHTLWGFSSLSRPDLSLDRGAGQLLLAWTAPDNRLQFAASTDRAHWSVAGAATPRGVEQLGTRPGGTERQQHAPTLACLDGRPRQHGPPRERAIHRELH